MTFELIFAGSSTSFNEHQSTEFRDLPLTKNTQFSLFQGCFLLIVEPRAFLSLVDIRTFTTIITRFDVELLGAAVTGCPFLNVVKIVFVRTTSVSVCIVDFRTGVPVERPRAIRAPKNVRFTGSLVVLPTGSMYLAAKVFKKEEYMVVCVDSQINNQTTWSTIDELSTLSEELRLQLVFDNDNTLLCLEGRRLHLHQLSSTSTIALPPLDFECESIASLANNHLTVHSQNVMITFFVDVAEQRLDRQQSTLLSNACRQSMFAYRSTLGFIDHRPKSLKMFEVVSSTNNLQALCKRVLHRSGVFKANASEDPRYPVVATTVSNGDGKIIVNDIADDDIHTPEPTLLDELPPSADGNDLLQFIDASEDVFTNIGKLQPVDCNETTQVAGKFPCLRGDPILYQPSHETTYDFLNLLPTWANDNST